MNTAISRPALADLSDATEPGHACTLLVPGSHRWTPEQRASWEERTSPADVVPLRVPAGTVLLWRSTLLHSVAPHHSTSNWRLHLMYSYVPRWFRPSYRGTFKHIAADPGLLGRSSPIRRQLLGAMGDLSDDGLPRNSPLYLFPTVRASMMTMMPSLNVPSCAPSHVPSCVSSYTPHHMPVAQASCESSVCVHRLQQLLCRSLCDGFAGGDSCPPQGLGRASARRRARSWLTAVIPMENPHCICKLTRQRGEPAVDRPDSLYIDQPGVTGHGASNSHHLNHQVTPTMFGVDTMHPEYDRPAAWRDIVLSPAVAAAAAAAAEAPPGETAAELAIEVGRLRARLAAELSRQSKL